MLNGPTTTPRFISTNVNNGPFVLGLSGHGYCQTVPSLPKSAPGFNILT
jgi:hypothetical protein